MKKGIKGWVKGYISSDFGGTTSMFASFGRNHPQDRL